MEVLNCEVSEHTGGRLRDFMPARFNRRKIFLNLGYGGFEDEAKYKDWTIINQTWAIKRAIDKRGCLIAFKKAKIPTLDLVEVDTPKGKERARALIRRGKSLVVKPRHTVAVKIDTLESLEHWLRKDVEYLTVYEEKEAQWRVNILCGRLVNVKKYGPDPEAEEIEYGNIAWDEIRRVGNAYPPRIVELAKQAVRCIGLGLSGVDLLRNKRGEIKVIEVNSAPYLSKKDVEMFYTTLWEAAK